MSANEIYSQCSAIIPLLINDYKTECEEYLVELLEIGREKEKIRNICSRYYSFLMNGGLSRTYISKKLSEHFIKDDIRRCSSVKLRNFFQTLSLERKEFTVYLGIRQIFANTIKSYMPVRIISKSSEEYAQLKDSLPEGISNSTSLSCVVFERISALNHYDAIEIVDSILKQSSSILFLSPTNVKASWSKEAYVREIRRKGGVICQPETSKFESYRLNSRSNSRKFMVNLASLMYSQIKRRDGIGFKLARSIQTAGLAERTESRESQLLSIWAAFEAVLPPLSVEDGVRILHFAKYISPSVTINYPQDTFIENYRDFSQSFPGDFSAFITENGKGDNQHERLQDVILLGSDEVKKELFKIISQSPLAQYRLYDLNKRFSDLSEFTKSINRHEQRVLWQINRIYRERNLIIHSGRRSRFLPGLVDNAFGYYSKMITNLEIISSGLSARGVEEAIMLVKSLKEESDRALMQRAKERNRVDDVAWINSFIKARCLISKQS